MSRSALVVTVSDGASHGTREDRSGDALEVVLRTAGFDPVERTVVADEVTDIRQAIRAGVESGRSLVVTTGGTGFGPRDVTPEATRAILEREAPGLVHGMLAAGLAVTPMAALSRPAAGTIGTTLVVNLPGSPKGAVENLEAILEVIPHALDLIEGDTEH